MTQERTNISPELMAIYFSQAAQALDNIVMGRGKLYAFQPTPTAPTMPAAIFVAATKNPQDTTIRSRLTIFPATTALQVACWMEIWKYGRSQNTMRQLLAGEMRGSNSAGGAAHDALASEVGRKWLDAVIAQSDPDLIEAIVANEGSDADAIREFFSQAALHMTYATFWDSYGEDEETLHPDAFLQMASNGDIPFTVSLTADQALERYQALLASNQQAQ